MQAGLKTESHTSLGESLIEVDFKKGLQELNSYIHFDLGAAHNMGHPQIENLQGVWFKGKHIGSMGRGILSEYHVYYIRRNTVTGSMEKSHIQRCGWRHTMNNLVSARIPGITWNTLCAKFKVPMKYKVA